LTKFSDQKLFLVKTMEKTSNKEETNKLFHQLEDYHNVTYVNATRFKFKLTAV